jgi:hypothetical protein
LLIELISLIISAEAKGTSDKGAITAQSASSRAWSRISAAGMGYIPQQKALQMRTGRLLPMFCY